ncbi:MAG TPA: DUF6452 family protein [Flavobacteriaceae bacterium]|nr:DUF6452 family protein [Flavobacteriaceae bacterium]
MYKVLKSFVVLLFVATIYAACTADDICSEETQTTPKMVISFADHMISGVAKPLNHLKIRNIEYDTIVWDAPADTISIPLSTEMNRSTYAFTIVKEEIPYTNIYQFDYNREEIYVSRACGYKMRYTNLMAEDISNTDSIPTWAKFITILNPIVEDEKSAHITILH